MVWNKSIKYGITIYDEIPHHPTAIETTLSGLRAKLGPKAKIIVILEFGSYTMRQGLHRRSNAACVIVADVML